MLWSPVSSRIGRRPVYLASTLISAALALACAYCTSYGTLIAVRILQAIAISPPQSTGAATITEMFFEHERGAKIGVWALLVTLGPPLAPLIFGFVVYHLRWQWIFYILSIIFLVEFCAYVVLGPETLYDRPPRHGDAQDDRTVIDSPVVPPSAGRESWLKPYVSFARHDRTPWSRLPIEIISPLRMFIVPTVFLPAMAYAVTFTFSNVLLTVETPALLGLKYGLNPQQQGLQFIAYLIGAVTGEVSRTPMYKLLQLIIKSFAAYRRIRFRCACRVAEPKEWSTRTRISLTCCTPWLYPRLHRNTGLLCTIKQHSKRTMERDADCWRRDSHVWITADYDSLSHIRDRKSGSSGTSPLSSSCNLCNLLAAAIRIHSAILRCHIVRRAWVYESGRIVCFIISRNVSLDTTPDTARSEVPEGAVR